MLEHYDLGHFFTWLCHFYLFQIFFMVIFCLADLFGYKNTHLKSLALKNNEFGKCTAKASFFK